MKMPAAAAILFLLAADAQAFEIIALGTSNTNCHRVERARTFTAHLERLLRSQGFDATVVNRGVDGDKPAYMAERLFGPGGLSPATRLVIFEPGPNDRDVLSNVSASERILARLQELRMPAIYVSSDAIQSTPDARQTAAKYGAHYYGHWAKDVPLDGTHRQYHAGGGGHLTAEGCERMAQDMLPLVKRVLGKISRGVRASPPREAN